jgi:carboxypeptidase Taq
MQTYKKLEERFSEIMALRQIDSLLNWDKSVMMPELGRDQRARQVEVLNVKIHELQTDPKVGEWLAKTSRKSLSPWQAANLDVMAWLHAHATAVPAALVARKMNQQTRTELIWRGARAASDFKIVRKELTELLRIVRDYAAAKAENLELPLYDALMDAYAPGMTSAEVDGVFDDLAAFLPPFIDEAIKRQKKPLPLKGPFPQERQVALAEELAGYLGMEPGWSRLDASTHPFSMGIGDDVRITTRYAEEDFTRALQAVAHEAGHGLYDRFTPRQWHAQPVGASQHMGLAIHESQSLSLDMQLARSREYWEFLAPKARKAFGREGAELSAENLYRHVTRVTRGFIRVEADEVTYPAHVILRYRLEKRMVEGRLEIKDLPEAWNAAMKALIGAEPPDDRRGCLQDIHWYMGAFGYFPTYALGAVLAAQYADKMKRDVPGLGKKIARGDFGAFTSWLIDNVQAQGCLHKPAVLVEKATGCRMSTAFFKKHLTERYLERAYEGQLPCSTTSARGAKRRA